MSELLFSYGTLQLEQVQRTSFGRLLVGEEDFLSGWELKSVEIKDPAVLAQSGQQFHPVAIPSTNIEDKIKGVVFSITHAELLMADDYEVDDYTRIEIVLDSGKQAWVYVGKEYS